MFHTANLDDMKLSSVHNYGPNGKTAYVNLRNNDFVVQLASFRSPVMTIAYDPHRSFQGASDTTSTQRSICFNTTDEALVDWVRALEHAVRRQLIDGRVTLSNCPFTEESLANCWSSNVKENTYGGFTLKCKWAQQPGTGECKVVRCYSVSSSSVFLEEGQCDDVRQGQCVVPVMRIKNVWYANGRCGLRCDVTKIQIQDFKAQGTNSLALDYWDGPTVEDERPLKRVKLAEDSSGGGAKIAVPVGS